MSMTVELRISGLAAFYRSKREDFWHCVFICDATHPVNFRREEGADWTPLYVKGKDRKGKDRFISISADQTSPPDMLKGDGFEQILNMARPEMHGTENLSVKRSGLTNIISMIIPSAKLGMSEETTFEYYLINNTTGKYCNIGPVARTAKATIELNQGNGLTMLIQDSDGASELAHFPYKDGTTCVLEFDNDCGLAEAKAENDFICYYDWLKDKDGTTFWAGRIAGALAEAEEKSTIETKTFNELLGILNFQNGNCDIVVIEPPPPNQP